MINALQDRSERGTPDVIPADGGRGGGGEGDAWQHPEWCREVVGFLW